jgi:CMP-N,N'-diacetyllegionaminic acid synthase
MYDTMIDKMTFMGLIPARGGSKSIPEKNIAPLGGKPLISYTIFEAKKSKYLNRVVVSTNSKKIAVIAKQLGAEVPFKRPDDLARDDTPGIEPILHALEWFRVNENYFPDFVMVLQPTSPFRSAEDIDLAIELSLKHQVDNLVSVCEVSQSPFWMKLISSDGYLTDFIINGRKYNRKQDLPPVYILNGAIYLSRCEKLVKQKNFFDYQTYAYVMPKDRSLDIDSVDDLSYANYLLKK